MKQDKKVLHVVSVSLSLPCFIGNQFDYFQNKGIEFYVACSPSEHLDRYAKEKKFKVYPVPILRKMSPIRDFLSVILLVKYIRKHKIDIVIGHTPKGGLLSMLAAYLAGVKNRVYFRHGIMYETAKGPKRLLLKAIEQFTGFLAKKVVCVSPSVLQISNEYGLSHPDKNIILGKGTCNGIDVMKFSRDKNQTIVAELSKKLNLEGNYVLGYVGRLVRDKGIIELIDAWKIIKQNIRDAKLLLVGPFDERDKLPPETIYFINTEPSIVHVGFVDEPQVYYHLMDLFILPSYREGFPTVILEASAMCLSIITTISTGCRNAIIPNETGIFSKIDAEDIATKINYYIDNKETAITHGLKGRTFVENNFKQEDVWKEIEKKVLN